MASIITDENKIFPRRVDKSALLIESFLIENVRRSAPLLRSGIPAPRHFRSRLIVTQRLEAAEVDFHSSRAAAAVEKQHIHLRFVGGDASHPAATN